jgi:hypothetical protein
MDHDGSLWRRPMIRARPDEEDPVKGYGPETFGDRFASVYDAWVDSRLAETSTLESVAVLADLAAGGPVLELAIGAGRVALPLAARGLAVHGIELGACLRVRSQALTSAALRSGGGLFGVEARGIFAATRTTGRGSRGRSPGGESGNDSRARPLSTPGSP